MSKFTEEFTEILEEHRKITGETYREVADKAGIDHSTISTIKSGKTDRPLPKTLAQLDRALGLPEGYLLILWIREHISDDALFRMAKEIIGELGLKKAHKMEYMPHHCPILNCENIAEIKVVTKPFFLQVKGKGVTGKDIHAKDLLFIAPKARIKYGDTVLWIHNKHGLSIRKYYKFGKKVHLVPLSEEIATAMFGLQGVKRQKILKVVEIRRKA